jgi:hypothetical protein
LARRLYFRTGVVSRALTAVELNLRVRLERHDGREVLL